MPRLPVRGWFPQQLQERVRDWPGGELPIVSVADYGEGYLWREDTRTAQAVPFGDGLALLQPCVVTVPDEDGEPVVDLEIGVIDGRPGIVGIRARRALLTPTFRRNLRIPRELEADAIRASTVVLVRDQGEVVGEHYVPLPTQEIRTAEGEVVGARGAPPEQADSMGAGRDMVDAEVARVRHKLNDEFFRRVAQVYRDAVVSGLSPEKEINRVLGPTTQARHWVVLARKRTDPETGKKFLGEKLGPWKAGEQQEGVNDG